MLVSDVPKKDVNGQNYRMKGLAISMDRIRASLARSVVS